MAATRLAARGQSPGTSRQIGEHQAAPLFRSEVMVERQARWLGPVLAEPRIAHWIYTALALAVASAIVASLFFGTYTRRAHVSGWLVPQQGMMRVFAPEAGVVTRLYAHEGMTVERGTPLLTVSAEQQSSAIGATRQQVVERLSLRRASLERDEAIQRRLFEQQADDLQGRIDALENEQHSLDQEAALQRSRIAIADKAVARAQTLRKNGLVTETRVEDAQRNRFEEVARLQGLQRSRSALERELLQLRAGLQEVPLRRRAQIAEIQRNVAALEQELAEAEARREIVITAPQDGIVTSLQVDAGGSARPDVPLMSIVPRGARLQAQLFAPSRAVGFVHQGQRVMLRYAAFPYQKFGFHEGVVTSVSRAAISPSEMPQQLSGLTGVYGSTEPLYRVTVALRSQSVVAYGERMPLQAGMQLDADVRLETRRLIEWFLEPIFSLRGTWNG